MALTKYFAGVLAACSLAMAAHAQDQQPPSRPDWSNASPSTSITISAGLEPGTYVIRARITDLNTSKLMSTPTLVIAAGKPAKIVLGDKEGTMVQMEITVDNDGKTADYKSEVRRAGRVESAQAGTWAIKQPT